MSSSTRFGFAQGEGGTGSGGSDLPPGARPPRDTQTIYGRELHLRPRAFPDEPPAVAAAGRLPPAPVRASSNRPAFVRQPPPHIPSHTGKSGFPSHAGVWGRRNAEGVLEPLTDPGLGGFSLPARSAKPFIQHVLVVLSAAFISFIAVLGVMKARQPTAPAPARAAEAAAAEPATVASAPPPPAPAAVPALAAVPAPPALPAPAPAVEAAPVAHPAAATASGADAVSAAGPRPARAPLRKPRPRRLPDFSRDPDSTLPPSF
jgi:hypothetical protein